MLRSLLGGAMADSAMALGAPQCSSAPAFFHHQRHFCFFSSTPRNCLNIRRRITASSSPPPSSSSSSSPLYSDSIDPIYEEKTLSVDLETIRSEEQFEEVMAEASHPKIINWMAAWCRKCIYLKPKLEKLAAEYPGVKFYCVDVNSVPQTLVRRADVTLWKDGEKYDEVIGGHKAWLVINEVREMLQNNNL